VILSDQNAISELLTYPLGDRPAKPRTHGLSMMIDKGMGYNELHDVLDAGSAYIDILKFGFGTASLYPGHILKRKLALAKLYAVHTCTGGTLGEVAIMQNKFEPFVALCMEAGFTSIEISDGTISLDAKRRKEAIHIARQYTSHVITEVGKKVSEWPSLADMVQQIQADLEAGANIVIVEGRESGENVGIYGDQGRVEGDILDRFIDALPSEYLSRLMWEAPKRAQQVEMLRRFGQTVNLGNIAPNEAIALECLRLGLRGDTLLWAPNADIQASTD